MPHFRLLATSVLVSAGVFTAAAQTPPAPLTSSTLTMTLSPLDPQAQTSQSLKGNSSSVTFSLTYPDADKPAASRFGLSPKNRSNALELPAVPKQPLMSQLHTQELTLSEAQKALLSRDAQLAQNSQPCYKLHVYGFTPQDLKSPHPHASTETDCTPASSAHLKVLQLPATVNVK
jgi:hypothetical protein